MRKVLHDELVKLNPDKDWSFVTSQIGMFSFTGMTPKQVRRVMQVVYAASLAGAHACCVLASSAARAAVCLVLTRPD